MAEEPMIEVIVVDGSEFDEGDLTAREAREFRRIMIDDLGLTWEQANDPPIVDYVVAATVVMRRRNGRADYATEQALDDVKLSEMVKERPLRARPTKPAAKTRAKSS